MILFEFLDESMQFTPIEHGPQPGNSEVHAVICNPILMEYSSEIARGSDVYRLPVPRCKSSFSLVCPHS